MIGIAKCGTVMSVICFFACVGGFEHGEYGFLGMLGRMMICAILTYIFLVAEAVLEERKRAREWQLARLIKTTNTK